MSKNHKICQPNHKYRSSNLHNKHPPWTKQVNKLWMETLICQDECPLAKDLQTNNKSYNKLPIRKLSKNLTIISKIAITKRKWCLHLLKRLAIQILKKIRTNNYKILITSQVLTGNKKCWPLWTTRTITFRLIERQYLSIVDKILQL